MVLSSVVFWYHYLLNWTVGNGCNATECMLADLPYVPLRNKSAIGRAREHFHFTALCPSNMLDRALWYKAGRALLWTQWDFFYILAMQRSLLRQRSVLGCEQPQWRSLCKEARKGIYAYGCCVSCWLHDGLCCSGAAWRWSTSGNSTCGASWGITEDSALGRWLVRADWSRWCNGFVLLKLFCDCEGEECAFRNGVNSHEKEVICLLFEWFLLLEGCMWCWGSRAVVIAEFLCVYLLCDFRLGLHSFGCL